MLCILKVEGKTVTVRDFEEGLKMCAIDVPYGTQGDYKVCIHERLGDNGKQMTLHFSNNRDNRYYRPMVVGEGLEVEPFDGNINQDNKYWFFKESPAADNTYSLRTVLKPSYYLRVLTERPFTFYLIDSAQGSTQVTAEITNTN